MVLRLYLVLSVVVLSCWCYRRGVALWDVYGERLPAYPRDVLALVNRLDECAGLDERACVDKVKSGCQPVLLGRLGVDPHLDEICYRHLPNVPRRYLRENLERGELVEAYLLRSVQDLDGMFWIRYANGNVKDYEIAYFSKLLTLDDGVVR